MNNVRRLFLKRRGRETTGRNEQNNSPNGIRASDYVPCFDRGAEQPAPAVDTGVKISLSSPGESQSLTRFLVLIMKHFSRR